MIPSEMFDRIAQSGASAEQATLDRSDRHTQDHRDLLVTVPLAIAQDEHGPLVGV